MASPVRLRAATRGSPLARWQTDHVAALLRAAADGGELEFESVVVETVADRRQDTEIWEMGGKGVREGGAGGGAQWWRPTSPCTRPRHMPAISHPDLVLAAVPERCQSARRLDRRDDAHLATGRHHRDRLGSARQLAWVRPDLVFTGLCGNIATRLTRIPDGVRS